jgi:hypothetical protein
VTDELIEIVQYEVDNGSASLKAKLAVGQIFLGAILMALNS